MDTVIQRLKSLFAGSAGAGLENGVSTTLLVRKFAAHGLTGLQAVRNER